MNQCQVINATGPNRGKLCKSKVGIKDRVCYNHRCRCIDTTVNREQDYQDEDYDYDDGFMVRDDEEAEFEDEEAEFEDEECQVINATGPNRGKLCKSKVGIIDGVCHIHRCRNIDTTVDREQDEQDEDYDYDDGFMVRDDEEAEFEDEEAEFEDDKPVCPEINWDTVDYDSIMLEHESKQVPDKKNTKKRTKQENTKNVVFDSPPLQRPTFDAIISNPPFAKVKTRHNTLENTFATMSLFDLRFFTGIQNINMQPIDERAFIISSYFTYTNCNV
jgi:hypothetical protein